VSLIGGNFCWLFIVAGIGILLLAAYLSLGEIAMNVLEKNVCWLFIGVGFGCFILAAYLSLTTVTENQPERGKPPPAKLEPKPASWGAAEGFAVAGGICFLAAGLVVRNREIVLPNVRGEGERSYRDAVGSVRGWGNTRGEDLD
jgi:hypothetical protein